MLFLQKEKKKEKDIREVADTDKRSNGKEKEKAEKLMSEVSKLESLRENKRKRK